MLQGFSGDVEGKVFRVHDSFDEEQIVGHQFFAVVHDKHATNIELDVVLLLVVIEKIEWSALRAKQKP